MSAAVTVALFTLTPFFEFTESFSPFTVFTLAFFACDVTGHDFGWDHVVCQDRDQLVFVFWFQQCFNCAFWKCRKGFVCWSEDCEGTITFQCVDKASCFGSGEQCVKRTCGCGCFNDVFGCACECGWCHHEGCGCCDSCSADHVISPLKVVPEIGNARGTEDIGKWINIFLSKCALNYKLSR